MRPYITWLNASMQDLPPSPMRGVAGSGKTLILAFRAEKPLFGWLVK